MMSFEQGRTTKQLLLSLPIFAWIVFDLTLTAYSSNVVTIFFPRYITEVLGTEGNMANIGSTVISFANSLTSLLFVLFSPLYGIWIDNSGRRKRFIVFFLLITIISVTMLGLVGGVTSIHLIYGLPSTVFIMILLFVISKFSYTSINVFYDSILPTLGNRREIPLISGFGIGSGYIGTILSLLVINYFIGDQSAYHAFIPIAILLIVSSMPLILFYKDPAMTAKQKQQAHAFSVKLGYQEIFKTFKEMKQYRQLFLFMAAYFFINDALQTAIAMMSNYAVTVVGMSNQIFQFVYICATLFAIVGAYAFGYITRRIGAKNSLTIITIILLIALILAALPLHKYAFFCAASLFGIALGSTWVASRTLIIELSPEDKQGRFFGLFAFSGKVSAIVGPFIYGMITLLFKDYGTLASRLAIGSLFIMAMIGLYFHSKVKISQSNEVNN